MSIFISREWLTEAKTYNRALQTLFAIVANHKAGVNVLDPEWTPRFMYRAEGGIMVNGFEHQLYSDPVQARSGQMEEDTTESYQRTVETIISVYETIKDFSDPEKLFDSFMDALKVNGIDMLEEVLEEKLKKAEPSYNGDTLRTFFKPAC